MSEAAIIQGALVDAKNVAAHRCVRLSIDVPAELGASIVKAFGWPTMAEPVSVAVARLAVVKEEEAERVEAPPALPVPKGKRRFEDMPPATQAALTCQEPRFWAWLREERKADCGNEDEAAEFVREFCEVPSRADIRADNRAGSRWQWLCSAYRGWLAAETSA